MSFCTSCGYQDAFCECRRGDRFILALLLAIAVVLLVVAYWPREPVDGTPQEQSYLVAPPAVRQVPPPRPRAARA